MFQITQASSFDEGFYQCIAKNDYGTAVSNTSYLRRAVIDGTTKNIKTVTATVGQALKLDVTSTKCYPPPTFSWEIGKEVEDSPRPVHFSSRMQIDQDG